MSWSAPDAGSIACARSVLRLRGRSADPVETLSEHWWPRAMDPVDGLGSVDDRWGVCGADWAGAFATGGLTRIYVAPRTDAGPQAVRAVVEALAVVTHGWAVEFGDAPAARAIGRGIVAHVPDSVARSAMGQVLARVAPLVRPGRPPMTFELAPGVSWSEDPAGGLDFGVERCRALALARDAAFDAEPRAFAESAAAAFVDLGLDPRRPWLRAA